VSVAIKRINDPTDDRIACYHRKNYDFRNLKARSLAWFVQMAIRRDMHACVKVCGTLTIPWSCFKGISKYSTNWTISKR
jgi:hypothetical protein